MIDSELAHSFIDDPKAIVIISVVENGIGQDKDWKRDYE